jgi:thiamine pyrophosphate-dependent acetolactate synthase large subunit-like protein
LFVTTARYGSDVVVDALQALEVPYLALNPGASFRGLHDSLVNYGGNVPKVLEVPHEKIAVGMAHGYAKAIGEPMGVVTHDLVGLLQATMGVFYAYVDRVPMLVLGGAGPMDQARRRPWIDWVHTANVQNSSVRDFTKWDDHPYSAEAIPESLARAWRVATMAPQGPVYVALDAAIQEEPLDGRVVPPIAGGAGPSNVGPDPAALERLAVALVEAERPVMITGYPGRDPKAWSQLVELAELLAIGVVDTNMRLNFPNRHPLNVTGAGALDEADAVLLVDVKDIGQHTQLLRKETRGQRLQLGEGAKLLDLGFGDLGLPAWTAHFGSWYQPAEQVIADTAVALPALLERCRALEAAQPERRQARQARRDRLGELHQRTWASWRSRAEAEAGGSPVSVARLAAEVGEAIAEYDWVLTAGTANEWALRTWDFDQPYRHLGRSLGTATQIGISLGAALAHRGSGKLVVDLQPDGDLMYDAGALWVATRHRIPMLAVMVNNRAYQNDWAHQVHMARERGNPVDRASIGLLIEDPAPDFATLARSFGWHAQGPVTDPEQVGPAVAEAAKVVAERGQPALVDVVCQAEVG